MHRQILRDALRGALIGGVFGGVCTFGWSVALHATASVRYDLPLFHFVGKALHKASIPILAVSPAEISAPYSLENLGEALVLLAWLVTANAAVALSLMLGFVVVTMAASAILRHAVTPTFPGPDAGTSGSDFGHLATALIAWLVFVPAVYAPFHETTRSLTGGEGSFAALSIPAIFVLVVVPAAAVVLFRRRIGRWARHLERGLEYATGVALGGFFIAVAVAFASGAGASVGTAHAPPFTDSGVTEAHPNVLLISIDSLRADHVHSYGYERRTTPTIDRLASEGARFQTVVAPTSWTLPSHVTLLTGLPVEVHGVTYDDTYLGRDAVTLAEVLHASGYATAGFVSAPYLVATWGFAQGFELYDDYSVHSAGWSIGEESHRGTTSHELIDAVSSWLDRWHTRQARRPFFLFVHMWDVHHDYDPPAPYDRMFDPDYQGDLDVSVYEHNDAIHPGMDPRDLEHVMALYDGEIRLTDEYVGKLVEKLRALKTLDDTILMVTADHGEEFFEHGEKGHRKNLYDETLLVPLIIRHPGLVPADRVIDEQVRLMDVFPTILDLTGVSARDQSLSTDVPGGADVSATIDDPASTAPSRLTRPRDVPVAESLVPMIRGQGDGDMLPATADLETSSYTMGALRTDTHKLIITFRNETPRQTVLYDLIRDPGEKHGLRKPLWGPDTLAADLEARLVAYRDTYRSSSARLSGRLTLSPAQLELLRALGYVR